MVCRSCPARKAVPDSELSSVQIAANPVVAINSSSASPATVSFSVFVKSRS